MHTCVCDGCECVKSHLYANAMSQQDSSALRNKFIWTTAFCRPAILFFIVSLQCSNFVQTLVFECIRVLMLFKSQIDCERFANVWYFFFSFCSCQSVSVGCCKWRRKEIHNDERNQCYSVIFFFLKRECVASNIDIWKLKERWLYAHHAHTSTHHHHTKMFAFQFLQQWMRSKMLNLFVYCT